MTQKKKFLEYKKIKIKCSFIEALNENMYVSLYRLTIYVFMQYRNQVVDINLNQVVLTNVVYKIRV